MRRLLTGLSVAAAILAPVHASAQTTDPNLSRLESELTRLSTIAGGKVGIGVHHLETGRQLYLNGDEPFPMASTFCPTWILSESPSLRNGRRFLGSI